MKPYYLMMDVGGTGVKAGVLDINGKLSCEIITFPAKANEGKNVILSNFATIIEQMGRKLPRDHVLSGIGMAFPGPFDYDRGVSLMKGLGKYDAIYNCSVSDEIKKRIHKADIFLSGKECPFWFMHDVEAFALGEINFGKASDCEKVLCLCIGTGTGSAFIVHGHVIKEGEGVPNQGWIYDTPFLKGQIDDYLSVRGLRSLSGEVFSSALNGEELFTLAKEGDKRAVDVFLRFGEYVFAALKPFLQQFTPEGLVLGGKISKSYPFFGEKLSRYCTEAGIAVYVTEDTSKRVFEGLYIKHQSR